VQQVLHPLPACLFAVHSTSCQRHKATCTPASCSYAANQLLPLLPLLLPPYHHLCCLFALQEGLMRKRIASINESAIAADQRRIAVDDSAVVHNSWLQEQGLSAEVAGGTFPLGGGSSNCY
jgi:hypothetical protein